MIFVLMVVVAYAVGFLGMMWLDPEHCGKARWNYSPEDWAWRRSHRFERTR